MLKCLKNKDNMEIKTNNKVDDHVLLKNIYYPFTFYNR